MMNGITFDIFDSLVAYANNKGILMHYDIDVIEPKYRFLFEKHGFATRTEFPCDLITNEDVFTDTVRRLIDEANELLNACKY